MQQKMKKLGDAELEIMQAIWSEDPPLTSVRIRKLLEGKRNWPLSTLMVSLSRLEDKGYLACERSNGVNLYTAIISENDYKAETSGSMLLKLYNNSARSLVATPAVPEACQLAGIVITIPQQITEPIVTKYNFQILKMSATFLYSTSRPGYGSAVQCYSSQYTFLATPCISVG